VSVRGVPLPQPATLVTPDVSIVLEAPQRFVSRGGDKLNGALAGLGVAVAGKRWLDAGASTGGFTDRLLQGGASAVAAVDVGYGQLHWRLRNDDRVMVLERTNIRDVRATDLPWSPEGVVADLSFISLKTVLPALADLATADADHVLLVKPQFEVGRDAIGKGGVVRDPELWRSSIEAVVAVAAACGLGLAGAVASHLVGPAGNREFFVHLRRGHDSRMEAIAEAVEAATR